MKYAMQRKGQLATGEAHPKAKLDWDKVRYIRENPENLRQCQLAEKFGIAESTLRQVIHNWSWRE